MTSALSFPLGVLQFIPVYHGLHDSLRIHSEICVLVFLTAYFLAAWTSDRRPAAAARTATASGISLDLICCCQLTIWVLLYPAYYLEITIQGLSKDLLQDLFTGWMTSTGCGKIK